MSAGGTRAAATPAQRLPRSVVARYATGSIGTGGFNTLPGLVLLYFLTDVLGIAAVAAGLVVTLTKFWDVAIDPSIGALSDRSSILTGSRRRLMRVGALTIPVFFVLTFTTPVGAPAWLSAVWVAIAFMLAATAFSLFQIPYLALAAEITDSYTERTRLQTWRMVLLTIGVLLFGGVAPAIRGTFDDPRLGYAVMAVFSAIVIAASFWAASTAAPTGPAGAVDRRPAGPVRHYRQAYTALRSSQPFRALLFSFVLKAVAIGLLLGVGQYVATWVLHREGAITWLFLALIGPALLVTPVWGALANRHGKEPLVYIAGGVFAAATLSLLALQWAPGPWVYLSFVVAGIGYAGLQSLPLSILPDVVAYESRRQGSRNAGVFTAVWTGGETAGLAVGPLLLALALQLGGYVSSTGGPVTQPGSALTAIVLSVSVVPAALVIASLLIFRGYRLRRGDIEPADAAPRAAPHAALP